MTSTGLEISDAVTGYSQPTQNQPADYMSCQLQVVNNTSSQRDLLYTTKVLLLKHDTLFVGYNITLTVVMTV